MDGAIQSYTNESYPDGGLNQVSPFEFVTDIHISKAYPATVAKQVEEGEKEKSAGKWVVEGFASTTDLDSQDHTITKEAIEQGAQSLQQYTTLLFNHDPNRPIGLIEKAEAQDGKLFIKAVISPSEPHIWKKIQDGTLSKFSVFGKIIDAEEGELEAKSILVIKSMELYEVSVVSVPANAAAKAIAWYVEKAFMATKGQDTGFTPQTLVPQSWITKSKGDQTDGQKVAIDNGKVNDPIKQEGRTPMAKNANVEQALDLLKAALEEAEGEDRQLLESQIASLESIQKGEGPINNDDENSKRRGRASGGNMGTNSFPTNFPPNTKKVSVGEEADLSLQNEDGSEEKGLLESLEVALKGLQDASPEFEGDDQAIATRVIQWIEAKLADAAPSPSSPGAANRTARASVDGSDAFSKAIEELKQVASGVVEKAQDGDQTLAEVKAIQKSVDQTAQAILAVAQNLTTTSLRKGQGPEADGEERDGNELDSMSMLSKAAGGDEMLSKMSPHDKLRLFLNRGVVGH
jgi:HK97 family phage prohead protease